MSAPKPGQLCLCRPEESPRVYCAIHAWELGLPVADGAIAVRLYGTSVFDEPKTGPLDVECPYFSCGAAPGSKCVVAHLEEYAGGYWDWHVEYRRDKPHAARIKAAQRAREEGK